MNGQLFFRKKIPSFIKDAAAVFNVRSKLFHNKRKQSQWCGFFKMLLNIINFI